jgi:hypothetical protein
MNNRSRQYTADDLYGADGRPHAAHIDQDNIYNCYFLAPMGALSEQQPDRVRDAIRYNAETGDFTVRLYRPPNAQEQAGGQTRPIEESITVSQDDIRRNISKNGGGTVDNNRERSGPLWPTVIEAGFAELYGRDAEGRVNLNRGYRTIGAPTGGGSLSDGTYALTGESGRDVQIRNPDGPPMIATGVDHKRQSDPPFRAPSAGAKVTLDAAYTEVEQALAAGRPVSMATQGRDVRDGLEESHAYMVVGVSRNPHTNEAQVTLRNPYADNQRAAEGNQNIGAGWNTSQPEITVNLNTLVREGSFAEFNIGPAARVQSQQQSTPSTEVPSTAVPPSAAPTSTSPVASPATPALEAPAAAPSPASQGSLAYDPSDITNDKHPGYRRFTQAIDAIQNSINIPSDTFTGNRLHQTAANIAYNSLAAEERPGIGGNNEALSRIDFAMFNKDRSGLICGEGDFRTDYCKRSLLPGTQDNANDLGITSQRIHDLLQDPQKLALANPQTQQTIVVSNLEPEPTGPRR